MGTYKYKWENVHEMGKRYITGRYINEKQDTPYNFTKINLVFYGTS